MVKRTEEIWRTASFAAVPMLRSISTRRRIGQGRDGRGLPRERPDDRPHGRRQDHGLEPRVRRRRARRRTRALLPGGRDRRAIAASPHREHPRRRRGARACLYRDGTAQGARPLALCQPEHPAADGPGAFHRRASCAGAVVCAPARRCAPRHQAGQHHVRPGERLREGDRLRPRAHRRLVPDQVRHGVRLALLHVARADGGRQAGRAQRPLFARASRCSSC